MPVDMGKAADQRLAVERLELLKLAAVDQPGDHLAHIIGLAHILRDDAVQFFRIEAGRARRGQIDVRHMILRQGADDIAHDGQRVFVALGDMIDHAALAPVQIAAAEILGADFLAGRRLHQRRAAQEDRALLAHDHALVGHGRHIGAARGAAAHHAGDLRNALRCSSAPG